MQPEDILMQIYAVTTPDGAQTPSFFSDCVAASFTSTCYMIKNISMLVLEKPNNGPIRFFKLRVNSLGGTSSRYNIYCIFRLIYLDALSLQHFKKIIFVGCK